MPLDYVSGMSIVVVATPAATGNVWGDLYAPAGASGQSYLTHDHTVGPATAAVTTSVLNEIFSLSLSLVAAGDYVSPRFTRTATHANDTATGELLVMGFRVFYTADS